MLPGEMLIQEIIARPGYRVLWIKSKLNQQTGDATVARLLSIISITKTVYSAEKFPIKPHSPDGTHKFRAKNMCLIIWYTIEET